MTAMIKTWTGASSTSKKLAWNTIRWHRLNKEVKRLQMRIAKAVREKRYGKAKALQWILTHSYTAKLLAIKRVTQNTGAKTPGIDGVLWKTPQQKIQAVKLLQRQGYQAQPLRRIYIPKGKDKMGHRPLSIPSMKDRAMQALYLLALEPVMEVKADRNAYGFRPMRSAADAIEQCFIALARKASAPWILEGDIRACFDNLSGTWLKNNILMDKRLLTQWLTAGYIKEKTLYPTFNGVPQGGIISPALLVLALKGLEEAVKRVTSQKDKINVVSYADDFIITGASKEVLEHTVIPSVSSFLNERGLELSPEKTSITHIDKGFDFLGFNIRKYKGKLLTRPSKKNIKYFLKDIRDCIKSHPTVKTETLIRQLNPKIRGWTNYFRHAAAKRIFGYIDHCIIQALIQWINRRHPTKNNQWKYKQYFRLQSFRRWIFSAVIKAKAGKASPLDLYAAAKTSIRRHVKIRADATPYDPQFMDYFLKRERLQKCIPQLRLRALPAST